MMKLISIIIPVYNAAEYLNRCLDSIIGQTYKNIEIIAVNDGSTDVSPEILNDYGRKDKRIRIINKENSGVSDCRNKGIEAAKGDCIMFVDSDDWLDYDCCEKLIDVKDRNKAQVVFFSYIREFAVTSKPLLLFEEEKVFDKNDCRELHRMMIGPLNKELKNPGKLDSFSTVWGKLYDSGLIREGNVSFVDLKEIGTAEDTLFNIEIFGRVKRAAYCDKCFYHYRKGSGMTSGYKKDLPLLRKNLFSRIENIINGKEPEYKEALDNRVALSITGLGLNILCNNEAYRNQLKELKDIINSEPYSLSAQRLRTSEMSLHWKFYFGTVKQKQFLCCYMMLLAIRKIITSKK